MRTNNLYRFILAILTLSLMTSMAGCADLNLPTEPAATASPAPEVVEPATPEPAATSEPVVDSNILYEDDFTNPATNWAAETFDNYFIGYHEPEYYHVAITGANYKTTVFIPDKPAFSDLSVESDAFTFAGKTAEAGDFRYGIAFRRSGDQYYAFTVSQRTKKWAVLKSSSDGLTVLTEGENPGIHEFDVADALRVDAQGSNFLFHINDQLVAEVEDSDYATGEVGFFAQTLDAESLHIHFDTLTVEKYAVQAPAALYEDAFTNPATGWAAETFDNYFIGYHEPEYYHIAITGSNYKTTVFIPNKPIFGDLTIESDAFTFAGKTAEAGDFRYGIAFRRSGDQYYAFTVSQRSKTWAVLKSSPSGLTVLAEGEDPDIHDLDVADALRVDAQGSSLLFHINDKFITEVDDAEYAEGEVGFFVQTLDAESLHIHFDTLAVRNYQAPQEVQAPQVPSSPPLYEDVFTNPGTNWPGKTFDNYFIGYHEPEYYHVAIASPNYRTAVFIPEKPIFSDLTMTSDAFTFAGKTAETGDFRYGLAFRRSGDQYYAFTVSQRTKKWAVLKSTPNALLVLQEGEHDGISELDVADALRVDAKGSVFFFYINDQFITQIDDSDYAEGEVGFYAQTLDATSLHIHFDTLVVREFEPRLVCTIDALNMNVRTGPGRSYTSFQYLSQGDIVQPIGRSPDGEWISIGVEGSAEPGWIADAASLVSCNASLDILPVMNP